MNDATKNATAQPADPRPPDFLELLPLVERQARIAFRDRDPETREEAVAEAVAAAFQAFVSLTARGIDPIRRFPLAMAHFAVQHVQNGRHVGTRASGHDVLCPRVRRRQGFRVERLGPTTRPQEELYGEVKGQRDLDAFEERLHDNTRTPVPEQAAFRIDFRRWRSELDARNRRMVDALMAGERTQDVARRFGVSPGRVSQKRRQFEQDWRNFTGDKAAAESEPVASAA